jgi:hypothetical protein
MTTTEVFAGILIVFLHAQSAFGGADDAGGSLFGGQLNKPTLA